jgi:hypothetical protein
MYCPARRATKTADDEDHESQAEDGHNQSREAHREDFETNFA